ncbi:hypothetical protein, partial [Streptomyces sp. LNU-CPARS28]
MQPARTSGEKSDDESGKPSVFRPTATDITLLTALIVLNVVVAVWNETHHEGHPRFGPWAGLGLQVVVVVVLVVRRVWPLFVLGVATVS